MAVIIKLLTVTPYLLKIILHVDFTVNRDQPQGK